MKVFLFLFMLSCSTCSGSRNDLDAGSALRSGSGLPLAPMSVTVF